VILTTKNRIWDLVLRFIVDFKEGKSSRTGRFPHAVLVQDNWDDYGYKSTFHVTLHLSKKESIDLGSVKIVEVDQTGGYTDMPRKPFTQLDEGFASLGADLDYYETLYKLGREVFEPYLSALHDIAYDDDAKALVEDTEGYRCRFSRGSEPGFPSRSEPPLGYVLGFRLGSRHHCPPSFSALQRLHWP
jgi:hypothetical protein